MTKGVSSFCFDGKGGFRGRCVSPSGDDGIFVASDLLESGCLSCGVHVSKPARAIEVDRSEMLRYLGYAGQDIGGELSVRIEEAAALCESVSEPRYAWRVFPFASGSDADGVSRLRLEGSTLELVGTDISRHLGGASGCVVMAVTLGLSNEREARRLSVVDPVLAMLFGSAGSALVETAVDACCDDVARSVEGRGFSVGPRFSPGYGDLPLSTQPDIVRALQADKNMGVIPQDSGMVIPTKSVTAIAGLFKGLRSEGLSPCETCVLRDRCTKREAGETCFR